MPDWCWAAIQLWRLFQGGGDGAGYLPDPGGAMDQPAIMMAAFSLMTAFEAKLTATDQDGKPLPPIDEDEEIDHEEVGRRVAAAFGI